MKKLGDIFGVFPDSGTVPRAISEGTVKKVNILNEVRVVTLWADFPALIEREALFAAEKEYSKLLNASVCIKPRFPSELFSADYFPQLYTAVRREMPSINGTLNNADVRLDGDVLTICLHNGGKALLDAKGFDQALSRFIAEEFGVQIKIRYSGTFEVKDDSEEYKQAIQSANKQIQREKLQKEADFFKEEEEISETVRERQAEQNVTEVEIREGSFATPQIIRSSVRPLYGRSIRGKMIPISNLSDGMKGAVVWGDVIEIEKRITKNNKNSIITIDITDYTGSVTVKLFCPVKDAEALDSLKAGKTIVVMGGV